MDKRTLTYDQQALISRMTEAAGELLFEATSSPLLALTETLGQLYGEAIRACKDYDGLQGEVTTTFMCGMAVRPNFGREEEAATEAASAQLRERLIEKRAATLTDTKSPGQLLYEKEFGNPRPTGPEWSVLCMRDREAWENEAMTRAEGEERDAERGDPAAEAREPSVEEREAIAKRLGGKVVNGVVMMPTVLYTNNSPEELESKPCPKCHGSGNMSLLGAYEKCDAC